MTHTGSPSPSVMKPMETLDTVLPSSSPWWTMGVSGGEGFKFRNQFANSVHDVLQFDGGYEKPRRGRAGRGVLRFLSNP